MLRPALQEKLIHAAEATGFSDRIDYLLEQACECVYWFADDALPAGRPGCSRLGGLPDLPKELPWPNGVDNDDNPSGYANLLAQFNLSEIPGVDSVPLPRIGHLWLFLRRVTLVSPIALICGTLPDPIMPPREAPANAKWAFDDLTTGSIGLRFEVGIDLPFGRDLFDIGLGLKSRYGSTELWKAIGAMEPDGRIGGYAFGPEGQNYCQSVALRHLGRPGIYPYDYETVAQMNESLACGPRGRVDRPGELEKWIAQHEAIRPEVEWIDTHRTEIDEWQLLMRVREEYNTDLQWGGAANSLWIFIRKADLAAGGFDRPFAVIQP